MQISDKRCPLCNGQLGDTGNLEKYYLSNRQVFTKAVPNDVIQLVKRTSAGKLLARCLFENSRAYVWDLAQSLMSRSPGALEKAIYAQYLVGMTITIYRGQAKLEYDEEEGYYVMVPNRRMYRYVCQGCATRWDESLAKSDAHDDYTGLYITKPAPYCLVKPCHCVIQPDAETLEMIQRLREEKRQRNQL